MTGRCKRKRDKVNAVRRKVEKKKLMKVLGTGKPHCFLYFIIEDRSEAKLKFLSGVF